MTCISQRTEVGVPERIAKLASANRKNRQLTSAKKGRKGRGEKKKEGEKRIRRQIAKP